MPVGHPWGMEEVMFVANNEPARSVLRRLGLNHWRVAVTNSALSTCASLLLLLPLSLHAGFIKEW
jgi:hypothetical protein